MPNRQELLRAASLELQNISSSPYLDAQLLMTFVLNISKEDLLINNQLEVEEKQQAHFQSLLERRLNLEPIAYIIGKKEFWGLEFQVNQNVLIPRPETELLVEKALQLIVSKGGKIKILDLGTGSGCIAIALAYELVKKSLQFEIIACDLSLKALEVASTNAKNLQVSSNITFKQSNWFEGLTPNYKNYFDLIISNPPYIAEDSEEVVPETKKFEPAQALYAKDAGLADLQHLALQAPNYLTRDSFLIMECGHGQFSAFQKFYELQKLTSYYAKPDYILDLAGRERIILLPRN